MKIFFDNCTPPRLASTLDGFIRVEGHEAWHIRDIPALPRGRDSQDIEWISYLRKSPDVWVFVSGDGRIVKNPAERAALRGAGLHGFVLAPALMRAPLYQMAALLIWRWPEIVKVTQLLSAPSMHEIPIGRASKFRQLPV